MTYFPPMLRWWLLLPGMLAPTFAQEPVSFLREVMPVLSKSGCNMGACHGNANGKGKLKLSLRGESPAEDYAVLTKSKESLRLNVTHPEKSSLLRKATRDMSHEGGQRFKADTLEYTLLRRWIEEGAHLDDPSHNTLTELHTSPEEQFLYDGHREVKITARAKFADGREMDVSRLAVYEPSNLIAKVSADGLVQAQRDGEVVVTVRYLNLQKPVRLAFVPLRPDFAWSGQEPQNALDVAIFSKLKKLRLTPSSICDDATFLRRASLDLLGRIPSADLATEFLSDSRPTAEKRAALVERFLSRPEYAEQWALRWSDLLRNEEKVLDEKGVRLLWTWLRDGFRKDRSVSEMASDLLTATGSSYKNPPSNYYRALRDPAIRAETTAQVFLGVRLQCARCHNHPFEKWTQQDYYHFAAVFDGIGYEIKDNKKRDKLDKHEFSGEQIVHLKGKKEFKDPRNDKLPPAGMLGSDAPKVTQDAERLHEMARWVAGADQTLFTTVQANRIWYYFMGQGVVEPVDDQRATNPAINADLLEELSKAFAQNGHRIKPLVRLIMASHAYQASSVPVGQNAEDVTNFSHVLPRRLTAEQLFDSLRSALGVEKQEIQETKLTRAGTLPGARLNNKRRQPSPCDDFLKCFGKPIRLISSEMERTNSTSLAQVFQLTSGTVLQEWLRNTENGLNGLLERYRDQPEALLDACFLRTLSRKPTENERQELLQALGPKIAQDRAALEDLFWALLNSKEFLLRR